MPVRIRLLKRPRRWLSLLISLCPTSRLRAILYRIFYGYPIARSAKIGFGTVITADDVKIGSATIGMFNYFLGPFSLEIGDGASVGSRNRIDCAPWATQGPYGEGRYARRCSIGANTLITTEHYIDAVGGFEIGEGSWIAGRGSQFWTHGAGVRERTIVIGAHNYLGSAVRFVPGSAVANHSLVAVGSVVTRKFSQSYVLIAGVPAKVVKEDYDYRERRAEEPEKAGCLEQPGADSARPTAA